MNKPLLILPVLCVLPALQSCTTEQKTASLPWKITPVMEVRNSTENPEAYYQLGRFYQGQSRHEMAAKEFEKAIAINPKYADAHNALGVSYAALGKLDLAVNQFNAAIALDPEVSRFHNNLGYAQYLKQDYAPAVSELKKAVTLDPNAEKAATNYQQALAQASTAPVTPAEPQSTTIAQPTSTLKPATPLAQTKPLPATAAAPEAAQPHQDVAKDLVAVPAKKEAPVVPAVSPVVQATTATQPAPSSPSVTTVIETKPMPVLAAAAPPAPKLESTAAPSSTPQAPAVTATALPEPIVAKHDIITPSQTVSPPVMVAASAPSPSAPSSPEPSNTDVEAVAVATAAPASLALQQQPASKTPSSHELSFDALKSSRFEIANGNGVTGMARRVGKELVVIGLPRAHLTNQKPFRQPTTVVQYREGYKELADQLSAQLPNNPPTRINNQLRASTDVRLVLGKDVAHGLALLYKARLTDTKLVLNQAKSAKSTAE